MISYCFHLYFSLFISIVYVAISYLSYKHLKIQHFQVLEISRSFPGLMDLQVPNLSSSSWMAVAWYVTLSFLLCSLVNKISIFFVVHMNISIYTYKTV